MENSQEEEQKRRSKKEWGNKEKHKSISKKHTQKNKRNNSLWLIDFSPFFLTRKHTQTQQKHTMPPRKIARTDGTAKLEESSTQGSVVTKKKMARRLLNGDGVDKDEAKAVSILEDCVALGDTDAMVMLAECCAFARGIEHNAGRAEALLSDAAQKGNEEARILMQLINHWKGKERVDLKGLRKCLLKIVNVEIHFCVASVVSVRGKRMIERIALAMNIVSCRELDLRSQT